MAYNKNTWADGPSGGTPLSAARLNSIEDGIAAAAVLADVGDAATPTGAELRAASVAATEGELANEASTSRATLAGLFSPVLMPSDVAPRTGQFDISRSIYTPPGASLRKTRAKLAAVRAGVAGARCKIAWVGHSEAAGLGSTVGVTSPGVQLRKVLAAQYPMGTGLVPLYCNIGSGTTKDSRWAYTFGAGNWEYTGSVAGGGNMQFHLRAMTAGRTATFTSDVSGTVLDIATLGVSAPFTYSVDGAAAVTVTPNGSSTVQIVTVTGLADTVHSVLFTTTTATATYLLGVGVRPAISAEVTALGLSGARASDWLPGQLYFNPYPVATTYASDLALVQLDANEALNAIPPATLATNMNSVVVGLKSTGADVVIVASAATNDVTAAVWTTYRKALYDLADSAGVVLLDVTNRLGPYATANANGLMFDTTHPNPAGYADSAVAASGLVLR